jgi:hypothetical protein
MIIIKLMGGLGNQMFQYALGRQLSIKYNIPFKLDLSFLLDRSKKSNFTYRNYDLDIFAISPAFANYFESLNGESPRYKKYINLGMNFLRISPFTVVQEKTFNFDKEILEKPDNCYFVGYWQSEKYFKAIESTIRNDFSLGADPDLSLSNQIQSSESICLNVRRGDYVTNPVTNKHHGVCNAEYFYKAIDKIKNFTEKPKIFVFSDDITWCIENLMFEDPTVFVTHNYAGKKFEKYLKLMSLCKYFIIPNSSFGWWAAWLSSFPQKKVIAPHNWIANPDINTDDLLPADWITI